MRPPQLVLPWRVHPGTLSARTLEKRAQRARRPLEARRRFKRFLWRKGFQR